ncbi:hypothetical protein N7519_009906 [Penicillium mononematosum]|uniref:uncharacterized protein n=1 Tax=Penicillium mononematosum TaxID=268346 RepID=UPI0025473556|nr:uncharacterized protein N7519_009906 [Penicillium mononematosum]KAJ6179445.1 hypothetical protein N7519_009906 [Penicillium mononematosum]
MKTTQFAVLLTGVLATVAMANPVAGPEPNRFEVAPRAKYTVKCDGGLSPDARCTNGKKKDGCRCDSKGTYLCDPSSLSKSLEEGRPVCQVWLPCVVVSIVSVLPSASTA